MVCSDCSYVLFEPRESQQRPVNTMSAALICKKFSRNPSKFHFPWKQNLSSRQKALKPETLLTLKVSQYRKSGSTSSGSEPVAASSDCCWLGIRIYKIKIQKIAPWVKESETPCVSACPSSLPKLCQSAAQRARPLLLQSKPSAVFWINLWQWLSGVQHRLELGLKLELCRLTNQL